MNSDILKKLLIEYDSKRMYKLSLLDDRKKKLTESSSEYNKLEKELHNISIESLKSMLTLSPEEKVKKLKALQEKTNTIAEKKNILLKKLNLPEDYLSPQFDCKLCEDTGYFNNELCSCIKQKLYDLEYNRANIGNVDKENFDNFNYDLYSDKIDIQNYNSQISPRENIKKIVDISKNFIKNFNSPDEKNLMFIGPTGLGKTFLSNCITKEILQSKKTVLYQTAPVMLDSIIDSKFGKDVPNILDHILNVDLLIIDDLGTEAINSMKFSILFDIINTRLLNQSLKITKTIISTNLNLKGIFEFYDERICSRLIGNYTVCRFFGDDIRLKKIKSE